MKKSRTNEKGFSLMELLVSLAIIVIIIISMIPLFNGTLVNIINSGKKSASISTAQKSLEDAIEAGTSESTYSLDFVFKAEGSPNVNLSIPGVKVDTTYNFGGAANNITVFVPKSN